MQRLLLLLWVLCCCGCEAVRTGSDWRDVVAVDMAVATMTDAPAPKPDRCERCKGTGVITHGDGHRTPCPDCQATAGESFGGPIDTLRDVRELIRKGNDLADRSKALLDAAQRDGKIRIDVQLPKPFPLAGTLAPQSCPGGICPVVPPRLEVPASPPQAAATVHGTTCPGGVCRPRLLWRFRR